MTVAIERHGDIRVSEPLLDDLGMNSFSQKQRCACVTQIVKPYFGNSCFANQALELLHK